MLRVDKFAYLLADRYAGNINSYTNLHGTSSRMTQECINGVLRNSMAIVGESRVPLTSVKVIKFFVAPVASFDSIVAARSVFLTSCQQTPLENELAKR
jgi:predicted SpoU family rRNA methylase